MAAPYASLKKYTNFFGIDLKSNDLAPEDPFAAVSDNLTTGQLGTLEKRVGYHPTADGTGPLGMFVYNRINPSTGVEEPEILSVSDELKKLKSSVMTLTYTGSGTDITFSLAYDVAASEYLAQIEETTSSGIVIFGPFSLGVGLDEAAPVTISDLIAQINASSAPVTAALASGLGTVPAAYLETLSNQRFLTDPLSVEAKYWEAVNSPGTVAPFAGLYAKIDDEDFEPISSVQSQNAIYFSSGYDALKKYDGQNVYRAGVPNVTEVTGSPIGSSLVPLGAITGNNYQYRIQYVQKDNNGVLVEGNAIYFPPQDGTLLNPVSENIQLSNIPTIQESTGFNVSAAVVSGNQTGVTTITLSSNTLQVGDTAYFLNRATGQYVEKVVTARLPNSITFAGAVDVNNGDVISNNLRIAIYRNENALSAPTVWYLVDEIPNNPFVSTVTYLDTKTDAQLGIEFVEPVTDRSPPEAYKYLTVFQGLMFGAGTLSNKNQVSWSDIENVEYWPFPNNQATVKGIDGDRITAIATSNDILALFQSRAIYILSGDVVTGSFRIEQLTNDIGCIAHQSIRDIRGMLFFLSELGPRAMSGGQIPRALGAFGTNQLVSRLDPYFVQPHSTPEDETLQLSRSWAFHDRRGQKYWLFIPVESLIGSVRYCNDLSRVFVYDYSRDSWMTWTEMNTAVGVVSLDRDVFFAERSKTPLGSHRNALYRLHTTGTGLDYQDHDSPISCQFVSKWDFLGEASQLKNFLSFRLWTIDQVQGQFTIDVTTEINFLSDNPISQFSLTLGSGGYGETEYGADPYGDPQQNNIKHKLSNGRAKSIRVILENDEPQTNIVITGYELEIAAPYRLGFKS